MGYSDYRLSWTDVNWKSALGMFQQIQQPLARSIQCDDPRSVNKYLALLHSLLEDADIVDRVLLLEEEATVSLSDDSTDGYEELDRIITRHMIKVKTNT